MSLVCMWLLTAKGQHIGLSRNLGVYYLWCQDPFIQRPGNVVEIRSADIQTCVHICHFGLHHLKDIGKSLPRGIFSTSPRDKTWKTIPELMQESKLHNFNHARKTIAWYYCTCTINHVWFFSDKSSLFYLLFYTVQKHMDIHWAICHYFRTQKFCRFTASFEKSLRSTAILK